MHTHCGVIFLSPLKLLYYVQSTYCARRRLEWARGGGDGGIPKATPIPCQAWVGEGRVGGSKLLSYENKNWSTINWREEQTPMHVYFARAPVGITYVGTHAIVVERVTLNLIHYGQYT